MEKNLYLTNTTTLSDRLMPNINLQLQDLQGRKQQLNQQTHLFIVLMGMVLGAVLTLFIAYHLEMNVLNIALLLTFPVLLTYMLRKVYIHTLVHTEHEECDSSLF